MSIITSALPLRFFILIAKTTILCLLLIFVIWLVLVLDWEMFLRAFLRVHPGWWILALAVKGFVLVLRGIRCYLLFLPETRLSLGKSIRYHILGQFGNVIFPAKIGEGAKVVLLKKNSEKSFWQVIFLAIGERLLDAWCIFLVLAFILQQSPFSEIFWAFGIMFGVFAGILTFFFYSPLSTHWLKKIQLSPSVKTTRLLLLTGVIWSGETLGLWFFLKSFHLGNFYQALAVTFFYHLAIAIPNTPGNLGVFEMLYVYAFGLFLMAPEISLSLACVVQISLFMLYLFLGFVVLSYEGIDLKALKQLGKNKQTQIVS